MVIDAIGCAGPAGFRYPAGSERVPDPTQRAQAGSESLVDQSRSPLTKVLQQTLSQLAGSNCGDPMVRSAVVDAEISLAAPVLTDDAQTDGAGCSSLQLFSLVCRAMALSSESSDTPRLSGTTRDMRDTLSEYTDDRDRKAVGVLIDLVA